MLADAQPVTDCITTHVIPALSMTVPDGINSTDVPAYLDLVHAFAGLAGLGSDYDGNGGTVRLGVTTSERAIEGIIPGLGQVVGHLPIYSAVDPGYLGEHVNPPFRPDASCAVQTLPDLTADQGTIPGYATQSATIDPAAIHMASLPASTTSPQATGAHGATQPTASPATAPQSTPEPAQTHPPAPSAAPSTVLKHLPGLNAALQPILGAGQGVVRCLHPGVGGADGSTGSTGPNTSSGSAIPGLTHALAGLLGLPACAAAQISGATGGQGTTGSQ
jgi:hypothetical protein